MSANSEGIDGFRPGHTSRQESVKTRVAEVHWWPDQESAAIKASTPFEKKYAVRRLHSLTLFWSLLGIQSRSCINAPIRYDHWNRVFIAMLNRHRVHSPRSPERASGLKNSQFGKRPGRFGSSTPLSYHLRWGEMSCRGRVDHPQESPVQPILTLFRSRSPDHQPGLWEPVGSAAIPYFKESAKPVHSFAR